MILTIRGPSGSGKSTLTRMIMAHYLPRQPIMIEKRRQPLGYFLRRPATEAPGKDLVVLGHYETPTGGGDTISAGLDYIQELTRQYADEGHDVLYEGLIVTSDFKRILQFYKEGYPAAAIVLNTSQEECEASVNARRRARGNFDAVRPDDIRSKIKVSTGHVRRWKDEGFRDVWHISREEAYYRSCLLLNLSPDHDYIRSLVL